MEHLRGTDFRQLLEFTQSLYALQDHESLIDTFVNGLPALIRGDVHSYSGTNSRDNSVYLRDAVGGPLMTKVQQECYAQFSQQHPSLAYFKRTGDESAVKISDFHSLHRWQKTDLYNLVYRPHKLRFNIGTLVTLSEDNHILMVLGISRGNRDFSERDRTLVKLLRPHLLQAYGNAQIVTAMERRMAGLSKAMDQLEQAIAQVDQKGKIIWATGKAQTLLQKIGKTSKSQSPRVPPTIWSWMQPSFTQGSNAPDIPQALAPLEIKTASSCVRLRMIPEGETVLLFLEEHHSRLPIEHLRQLGLSSRETEVLGWVVNGKSNPEIAEILGIGIRTVKTHLERIYDKLGVDHRYAAMLRAFEVMGVTLDFPE